MRTLLLLATACAAALHGQARAGSPYLRQAPASTIADSPFAVQVDCNASLACQLAASARLKVIESDTVVGINDPPDTACQIASPSRSFWRPVSGFADAPTQANATVFTQLVLGPYYVSGVAFSKYYDACYCYQNCTAPDAARYSRVGQVRVAPLRMVRFRESGGETGVRAVGVAGDLMVDGRANVPLLPRPAQAKLLWDRSRAKTSADCASLVDLVEFAPGTGPVCDTADACTYKASPLESNPADINFQPTGAVLFFNDGGTQNEQITFDQVGVVAVCYCGVLAANGDCLREAGRSYWILLTRTLIRGPCLAQTLGAPCVEQTWRFVTGLVFHLELSGLGLKSTDKVRIIPATGAQCAGNPDGGGAATVLKNCPGACNPLNLANSYNFSAGAGLDDIDLYVTTSDNVTCSAQGENCTSAPLAQILLLPGQTVWRFEADPQLADGDVVVLDGVHGGSPEENAMMAGQVGMEPIGWRVTRTQDPTKYTVPVLFDKPVPPILVPDGPWHCTNRARTRAELKATAAAADLQVCWGTGPDSYHARAGRITFADAAAMPSAVVALTTLEANRRAPAIVAFETTAGGDVALKYKTAVNGMELRLSFNNVKRLEPRGADVDGLALPDVAPLDRTDPAGASVAACGGLFLELWSDDTKGFPMPKGCYFSSLGGATRDLHIVFDARNGLEAGRRYQVVLNMIVAREASTSDRLLSVWSMDDTVLAPYGVVELGDARISASPMPASANAGEPRFAPAGGLTLLDQTGAFLDLVELTGDPATLMFKLKGDGRNRIVPSSILRVYLWPLTVWDLGATTCQAQCIPPQTLVCGAIATCACDAVVQESMRNIIRLQLPMSMSEIYGAIVQHTVRVTRLALPDMGFFGTRFGAQVSSPDDSRVHYTESSGAFVWKRPSASEPQVTVGSVVTNEGDGNDRPFRGDVGNTLYVRLSLGAALMSEIADGDAYLQLKLPPGYTCRATSRVPATLGVFGSAQPQGRGSLPASGTGTGADPWRLDGSLCTYRLRVGEVVPAGTPLLLQLTVDNPAMPLQQVDSLNQWSLGIGSKGWYRKAFQDVPAVPFVDGDGSGAGLYSASIPVLGKLPRSTVQPGDFSAGTSGNTLQVFFRPEQQPGYNAVIMVIAPFGFDFVSEIPDKCQVSRLPSAYYKVVAGVQATYYLPIVVSCLCDCAAAGACSDARSNRAKINIKNSLQPAYVYGFALQVNNKADYSPDDETAWSIAVVDGSGFHLDASNPGVPLNPAVAGTNRSWGVFAKQGDPSQVTMQFSSLWPTVSSQALTSITFFPIALPASFNATCKLIAPEGYELTPVDFRYQYGLITGATATWPGRVPWQSLELDTTGVQLLPDQAANVLLWLWASYSSKEKYGFRLKTSVPGHAALTSGSAFFLLFGWDAADLAGRPLAYVLPAPALRVIQDFVIGHQTNVAGLRHLVSFFLETATDVPVAGAVQIQAPQGFVFEQGCALQSVPGDVAAPSAVQCRALPAYTAGGAKDGTLITILATTAPLPAGRLAFAILARNPATPETNRGGQQSPCGHEICWSVRSLDASGLDLDAPSTAPGFAVQPAMPGAKLLDLDYYQRLATGRNDRPGRPNNLIFSFTLANRPSSAGELILSGPYGFQFEEDCMPGLRILNAPTVPDQSVFGSLSWLPGYAVWEAAARVESCLSQGSTVRMYVELGLRAALPYVFRIAVAANPTVMPSSNSWTIEYSGESSPPIQGFTLWTFTEYQLTPRLTAQSLEAAPIADPVTLRFRPNREVRADPLSGGLLRLTAPAGFRVATAGSVGKTCAEYTLADEQTAFVPRVDVQCSVDEGQGNSVTFALVGYRKLEAGKLYFLVVQVYNPTSTSVSVSWTANTFSDPSGALESALDSTSIPGFPVNLQVHQWAVVPPDGEQHAGVAVANVAFQMAFASDVGSGNGGEVHIRAPAGFDLDAPLKCVPQVGTVAGTAFRLGTTTSLLQCAASVWQVFPNATAASWANDTLQCAGYTGVRSVKVCGPVPVANTAARMLQAQALQCAGVTTQVCAFSVVDRACRDFAVTGTYKLSVAPTCSKNSMTFRFVGGDLLPAFSSVAFTVSTRNPATNPGLVDRFWSVEQYDGQLQLLSSGAVLGWTVIPVLQNASVQLTGTLYASGRFSQLTVRFVPTSAADTIQLVALGPTGFNMSGAVLRGSAGNISQRDSTSVTIRRTVVGGQALDPPLVLDNVGLPLPGPASFRIRTLRNSVKQDEILNVSGTAAFNVPGRVQVVQQRLQTIYALSPDIYPYLATFRPRTSDFAVASFNLTFQAPVLPGDILAVSAPPFAFPDGALFRLTFRNVNVNTIVQTSVQVTGVKLRVVLLETLQVGLTYTLQAEVQTGPSQANQERWRFETQRGSVPGLPVNTNDAVASTFALVRPVTVSLSVGRVAPRAMVDLDLIVDPGHARPTQLVLYAPVGYVFPAGSCLRGQVGATSKVLSCRRLDEVNMVELELSGDGLQVAARVPVTAQAPDQQVDDVANVWLVRAMVQDVEVGWGQAQGFAISQMQSARVIFGGAPAVKAHMAVVFTTAMSFVGGGTVEMLAPEVYKFSCRPSDGFDSISLPGVQSCDDAGIGIRVSLNGTFAPGSYAFVVGVTNPAYTPVGNVFSVLLRDSTRRVVDAYMNFPGPRITQGLYVRPLILRYSSAMPLDQAEIQITLWLYANLDPLEAIGAVRAVQIAVPDSFTLITRLGVQNLDGLPTPESGWGHLYSAERLVRVAFVTSLSEKPRVIPAGQYRLSFQVRNPEFWMPSVNIWLLSLCRDLGCTDLVATLAVAGFRLKAQPTLAGAGTGTARSGGCAVHGRPVVGALAAAALLMGVALLATDM